MDPLPTDRFKVLIVDDIPDNIRIISDLLQHNEISVGFALSGEQGIRAALSLDFDLILLDISMPEMDGFEVCKILKSNKLTADIPIIFLTARTEQNDINVAFSIGAVDYITKPFNRLELLSRVRTHIELKRQRENLILLNQTLEEKVTLRTNELAMLNEQLAYANSKLSRLDSAKSDFLYLINHELRTPLNGIFGFSGFLQNEITDVTHKEYLSIIIESANQLLKLTELSLLITELRAEHYEIKRTACYVETLLSVAIKNVQPKLDEKKIEIKTCCNNENLMIYVDYNLVAVAFQYIIENAINFTGIKSEINIHIYSEDEFAVIDVADKGPGFSQEVIESLFELFITGDVKHHSKGLGLSLVTAKMIMQTHSGKISIKNRPEGGASVRMVFPKYENN